MQQKKDMESMIENLKKKLNLKVDSPCTLNIRGESHTFKCLISGYGAKCGMIVDKDWGKFQKIQNDLSEMGYGFSCFDIEEISSIENFQDVLNDWGKTAA